MIETYTAPLTKMFENGIFVFGSNTQGRHGKGSALTALNKFGAVYGQSKGLQGKSYAIITKDLTKRNHPSVSEEFIINQISELYEFAKLNKHLRFYIPYTNSANLNSYDSKTLAGMFVKAGNVPINIVFDKSFYILIYRIRSKTIQKGFR